MTEDPRGVEQDPRPRIEHTTLSDGQPFEDIVREWLHSLREGKGSWQRFTRLTMLLCACPVLPVPVLGVGLGAVQLVLVGRRRMSRTQLVPLLLAVSLGVSMTVLAVTVLYPLGYQSYRRVMAWIELSDDPLLRALRRLIEIYGRLFVAPFIRLPSPPTVV